MLCIQKLFKNARQFIEHDDLKAAAVTTLLLVEALAMAIGEVSKRQIDRRKMDANGSDN